MTSTNKADAAAAAAARAKAGAKASSTSHSGVGDVSQGLTTGDDRSRFLSLVLPPPAYTAPMAPIDGCAAEVTQEAGSITLLGSRATARTDPTVCHVLAIRNAKVEACHFASAKHVEDLLLAKLLPGYQANPLVLSDLSPAECAALKAPPLPAPLIQPDRPAD